MVSLSSRRSTWTRGQKKHGPIGQTSAMRATRRGFLTPHRWMRFARCAEEQTGAARDGGGFACRVPPRKNKWLTYLSSLLFKNVIYSLQSILIEKRRSQPRCKNPQYPSWKRRTHQSEWF